LERRLLTLAIVVLVGLAVCFAAAAAPARVVQTIGNKGELRLRAAVDAALGPGGVIYVLDMGDSSVSPVLIKVFSPDGNLIRSFDVGRLAEHGGVPHMAVDPAGNAYVGAPGINEISKYSQTGQELARWSVGTGVQDYAFGLAADRHGNVLALEGNGRLETFDGMGRLLASWQRTAISLTVSTSGTIYIADEKGVAVIDTSGNEVSRVVRAGKRPGQFSYGRLVAGPAGSFYVVESHRIQKFGPEGRFLGSVGGDRHAQWTGAAVAGDGNIYAPQGGVLIKFAPITTIDVVRPSIAVTSLSMRHRAPALARLAYKLSEDASFRVSLRRRAKTRDPSNRDFGRYLYLSTVDVGLTSAGRHRLVLRWRSFGYQHLHRGRYLLMLIARDDAGNESVPARVKFSVHE
jgi:hypothetical protein